MCQQFNLREGTMGKFIKYLFYTILTLVLLVVIGVGVLVATFNPNNLKGPIAQQVKAETGRDMTINGDITWRFFPWLGFSVHGIQLSNDSKFDQTKSFLSLNEANVNIKVMPLFSGNIEIGKITLDGLKVNLITNAQGENNWDILAKTTAENKPASVTAPAATTASSSNSKFKLTSFNISAIDISNAAVSYDNLKTNQKYLLQNFNLDSQNIRLNAAVPVVMSFDFNSSAPNINGTVNLNTQIDIDQAMQVFSVSPFILNATLNGSQFPKNGLTFNLQSKAVFNKTNGTLDVSELMGKIANMQFNGKVGGIDLFKKPIFNGNFNINAFDPKIFLQSLGMAAPDFQNKNAFTKASLNSQFILTPTTLAVRNIKLGLDQSTLTGEVSLALAKTGQSQFNLNLNKIDLSNYLMAKPKASVAATPQAPSPSQAVAATTQMLPVQALRQLNLTGKFAIGTLNFEKFQMTNVNLNMSANNGLLQLAHNSANLYQGQWLSNIALNVQNTAPAWQVNEAVNNVEIAPLLNAFYENKKYQVTGTGDIKLSVTTNGNTQAALTQNLNGSGKFALNNGVVKGINLGHQMDVAMALVNKQTPPAQTTENQTPFGSLTGTVQINNGVVSNNDLSLQSPALKVSGNGTVNLVSQQVQYQVASTAVQGQVDPKIYALQEKIGGSIPIIISGTFASLRVYPDLAVILKNIATAYVKQNTDKIKDAVENQVQKITKGGLGKNLQDSLQNGLNSLFKQ